MTFISACLKGTLDQEEGGNVRGVVAKLNKNVEGLRELAHAVMDADSVSMFSVGYNNDGSVLYLLNMSDGESIELYSEIVSREILVPGLSMEWDGNDFYWSINGILLTDSEGTSVAVTDLSMPVTFFMQDESICCRVNNDIVCVFSETKAAFLTKDVTFDYSIDDKSFSVKLSSGYSTCLPTISAFHL